MALRIDMRSTHFRKRLWSLIIILIIFIILFKLKWRIPKEKRSILKESTPDQTEETRERLDPLQRRVVQIKEACGEICDTSVTSKVSFEGIPFLSKNVRCQDLFTKDVLHSSSPVKIPLKEIPESIVDHFTYDGRIKIRGYYLNDAYQSKNLNHWTRIEENVRVVSDKGPSPLFFGPYGLNQTKEIYEILKTKVALKGRRVLVIGSMSPWIEVMALALGASEVTTLEYGKIISGHNQVKTLTPPEFRDKYLKGELKPFDVIISYSSLEHSGLGRYGDSLNPWADLITMAQVHCASTNDAVAVIGIPFARTGEDAIEFNAHKCYGPLMLSHLFANWKTLWRSEPRGADLSLCSYARHHGIYVVKKSS